MTSHPEKIFVACDFLFYDQYLQPVVQRCSQQRSAFFALEPRAGPEGNRDVYVFDCRLNEHSLFVQKDMLIADGYLHHMFISKHYIVCANDAKTEHDVVLFDTTPFDPVVARENKGVIPIFAHSYCERRTRPAIMHSAEMKCGVLCTGIHFEVPAQEMIDLLRDIEASIAQSILKF